MREESYDRDWVRDLYLRTQRACGLETADLPIDSSVMRLLQSEGNMESKFRFLFGCVEALRANVYHAQEDACVCYEQIEDLQSKLDHSNKRAALLDADNRELRSMLRELEQRVKQLEDGESLTSYDSLYDVMDVAEEGE